MKSIPRGIGSCQGVNSAEYSQGNSRVWADHSTEYSLGNSKCTRCGQIPVQSISRGIASCQGVDISQFRVLGFGQIPVQSIPGELQVGRLLTDPSSEYS